MRKKAAIGQAEEYGRAESAFQTELYASLQPHSKTACRQPAQEMPQGFRPEQKGNKIGLILRWRIDIFEIHECQIQRYVIYALNNHNQCIQPVKVSAVHKNTEQIGRNMDQRGNGKRPELGQSFQNFPPERGQQNQRCGIKNGGCIQQSNARTDGIQQMIGPGGTGQFI